MKVKIDKLDYIRIKNFSVSKETINTVKGSRQNSRKCLSNKYLIRG